MSRWLDRQKDMARKKINKRNYFAILWAIYKDAYFFVYIHILLTFTNRFFQLFQVCHLSPAVPIINQKFHVCVWFNSEAYNDATWPCHKCMYKIQLWISTEQQTCKCVWHRALAWAAQTLPRQWHPPPMLTGGPAHHIHCTRDTFESTLDSVFLKSDSVFRV